MRDIIIEHFAKALWVSAYAGECGEIESRGDTVPPSPGPQQDWMDYAPPVPATPEVVIGVANAIAAIETAWGMPVEQLLTDCMAYPSAQDVESYGHYLGMQYIGSGVGLHDWAYDREIARPIPDMPYGYTPYQMDNALYDWLCENGYGPKPAQYRMDLMEEFIAWAIAYKAAYDHFYSDAANPDAYTELLREQARCPHTLLADAIIGATKKVPRYCCPDCGGVDVVATAWVNVNTQEIGAIGVDGPLDVFYCNTCEEQFSELKELP